MRICFFFVAKAGWSESGASEAAYMVRSARRAMPGIQITQLSDMDTAAIEGVDDVRRRPSAPLALLRVAHHAMIDGDVLFCDTDVVFERDVRHVFDDPWFEVAVTDRDWPGGATRPDAGGRIYMEYNIGVIFTRSRAFWREVYSRVLALPSEATILNLPVNEFMGDQIEACAILRGDCAFRKKVLSGLTYNYPPDAKGTDKAEVAGASILHYKGNRKPLLRARIQAEREQMREAM